MARRRLTGSYVEPGTGTPQQGFVVIAPIPSVWTNTVTNEVISGHLRIEMSDGNFSTDLTPTDEPGVLPADGRRWRLTEFVRGALPRTIRFEFPAGTDPVDVTDLVDLGE